MIVCPISGDNNVTSVSDNLSYCEETDHYFQTDLRSTVKYDGKYQEAYGKYPTETMSYLRAGYITAEISRLLPTFGITKAYDASILDFGYGTGEFLHRMAAAGYNIYGLDLHGIDFGIPEWKVGIDAIPTVVTSFDSIEHLPNFDFFFALRPLVYAVSTPYRHVWFGRQFKDWKHYKPGEHLHYFSPRSLERLFSSRGYDLVSTGSPEDIIRGKITMNGQEYDNILVSTFRRRR